MGNPPTTRPSLLVRIRDGRNADAWREFVDLYAPLVYRFARQKGLQDADAADLTQEVLRAVSRAVGGLDYDPRRGSFRGWLFTLAYRKYGDFLGARKKGAVGTGDSATSERLHEVPAPEEEDRWNQEHQRRLFDWAAGRVRGRVDPTTWQAFWQSTVEGRAAPEVARSLGMSVGAVYIAKSRVQARLRETIRGVESD